MEPRRLFASIVCTLALASCIDDVPPPTSGDPPDASPPPATDAGQNSTDGGEPNNPLPGDSVQLQFVDPDHGTFAGGTEVMVRGFNFDPETRVSFGGRLVEPLNFQYIDTRRILVRTPPGEPGLAEVSVERDGDIATLDMGYRFEPIQVDPPSGSVAGGTFITITGLGTDFASDTVVTIDGLELVDLQILSDQSLTGYTPPGAAGTANISVITQSGVFEAERAFTYEATGDPFAGGMSGGPIDGAVNIVVIDSASDNGIPDALVAVGDPASSSLVGRTDFLGQITFSTPDLTGPITVIAAAEGYETAMFVEFDAENITIFLRRPPEPAQGPLPPAPQSGHIYGHVMFGDATTLGSPYWDLVPEPRTATERKRMYVTTTSRNMFGTPYAPTQFIDYQFDPDVTAWEFDVWARPSATALVAIAGLYDPERDPSGTGTTGFEPFAMGVTRGVLVGPGENLIGVDVVVNVPLDSAVHVQLDAPPALNSPGYDGPQYYKIRPFIDLGGEGVILMNKNGMLTPPAPEDRPNHYRFAPGQDNILLSGMSPLSGPVSDSTYGFIVGAYTETDTNPYSARVVRGFADMSTLLTVGDFIGNPRQLDPVPGAGPGTRIGLSYELEAPSTGAPTYNLHLLTNTDGVQVARIIARGDVRDVDIPDLTAFGLPPFPAEQDISWTLWSIRVAGGGSFDEFTYRQLSSLYWEAYAVDSNIVQFPNVQ